jgi:small conductance mechanosensitive channel
MPGTLKGMRNRLADVWHILASAYIIATFCVWALQVSGGFAFIVRASLLTMVIIAAANLLANVLAALVDRAFAISADLRSQFPHLEARANRYLAIMRNVVRCVVVLGAALALGQAWGANTLTWLGSDVGRRIVSSTLLIATVIVGALIIWEQVSLSIERYLSKTDADGVTVTRSSRTRTLLPLLRHVIMMFLLVLVVLIVLSELGLNIAPLLAGAGVIGVAIGFGSQKLVQDVITGAFILFEDTIAIGDVVKIDDHAGVVEGMTIRTIRLRDGNGQVHTMPFSSIKTVTNMSRDFGCHLFEIGVAYREDVDQVMAAIRQLGDEMQSAPDIGRNILSAIEVFGIDRFTDRAVIIQGKLTTPPNKQWEVGREFNRRLKKRFDELGIEMPYPTTTLYFGADKEGDAPPAHLRLERRADPTAPATTRVRGGRSAGRSLRAPADG